MSAISPQGVKVGISDVVGFIKAYGERPVIVVVERKENDLSAWRGPLGVHRLAAETALRM